MTVGSGPAGEGTGTGWRGVNLGGWLVLEEWMSPKLFEDVAPGTGDEASLMRRGGARARDAVARFRDTFITEEDFRWLREVGQVNAVRLPVGFWCLEEHAAGTPFLPTQAYVDAVFEWAEAYGLKVLLDFHGAAGSQNTRHHSGAEGGQPRWLQTGHRARNLEVLRAWASRWGTRKAFMGLGLGNEVSEPEARAGQPGWLGRLAGLRGCCAATGGAYWDAVAEFYVEAAARCRPHMRPDAVLVIDTCWNAARWGDGRLLAIAGPVLLDYHHYECMGQRRTSEEHCEAQELRRQFCGEPAVLPLVLGEFSLALSPQCEGYHDKGWQRRFFERQTRLAAQHGAGWFFWSYKMAREGWPHWSFRECLERGWIPAAAAASGAAGAGAGAEADGGARAPWLDGTGSTGLGSDLGSPGGTSAFDGGSPSKGCDEESEAEGQDDSPASPLLAKPRGAGGAYFSPRGCEGLSSGLGCMPFVDALLSRCRRAGGDASPGSVASRGSPSRPPTFGRDFCFFES